MESLGYGLVSDYWHSMSVTRDHTHMHTHSTLSVHTHMHTHKHMYTYIRACANTHRKRWVHPTQGRGSVCASHLDHGYSSSLAYPGYLTPTVHGPNRF